MEAFLHFGKGEEPRQTIRVPARIKEPTQHRRLDPRHDEGRTVPMVYQVQWEGIWRRVYRSPDGAQFIGSARQGLASVTF